MRWRILIGCLLAGAAAPTATVRAEAPLTLAQQAAKLYTTAISQYRAGQTKGALQLFDQFVQKYPTHENIPAAYLTIAEARKGLKDAEGSEEALDQVIRRFYPSPSWWKAYWEKLALAKARGAEEYMELLEKLEARAKALPLNFDVLTRPPGENWYHNRWSYYHIEQAYMPQVIAGRDWVWDAVQAAKTPKLAEKALSILASTLRIHRDELPPGWQYSHVELLRRAGRAEEADKQLQEYLDAWGDDPRALSLWMFLLQDARARNDAPAAEKLLPAMIARYNGCISLAAEVRQHVIDLARAGRYDEFTKMADLYMKAYSPNPHWNGEVFQLQLELAKPVSEGDKGFSRIRDALAMLDKVPAPDNPAVREAVLPWRIELYNRMGRIDEAAGLARELVSEKYWSSASLWKVQNWARQHPAYAKVVAEAKAKWGVPELEPKSIEAEKLQKLREHLRKEEVRHAEDLANELMIGRPGHAATVEAMKAMTEYYRAKVLRQQRDKWADRIITAFPYHPLTEQVLEAQIAAMAAEQLLDRQKALRKVLEERFPGGRIQGRYESVRDELQAGVVAAAAELQALVDTEKAAEAAAAKANPPKPGTTPPPKPLSPERQQLLDKLKAARQAVLDHVVKFYGGRAAGGEIAALEEIAQYQLPDPENPGKTLGDFWMESARKLAGTRSEIYCLCKACQWYVWYDWRANTPRNWDGAIQAAKRLQAQPIDAEVRWKAAFADVNLLAAAGRAHEAWAELQNRLGTRDKPRGLAARLDMPAMALSLVGAKRGDDLKAYLARIRAVCHTTGDENVVDLAQAQVAQAIKDATAAARFYLAVVDRSRWPLVEYWYLNQSLGALAQAGGPQYASVLEGYIKKVGNAQDVIPGLLQQLGTRHLSARNPAALRVRDELNSRYPASAALDQLNQKLLEAEQKARGN